jgi:large subunit ribosomal protein L9
MEILLIENVPNLGARGDVVNVKDGYARNFLLPKKKALPVTSGNKKQIELEKARNVKIRAKELAAAQDLKARLDGVSLAISKKAGDQGQLFGSVTNADVAELLKAQGFEIDRHSISVPHVKAVGAHEVEVKLYTGVHSRLQLTVTAQSTD